MLSGLHFLLTYQCLYECDHCFLYCGPRMSGTFSLAQIEDALDQGVAAGITEVFFEGGEPFLYYPILIEAIRLAKERRLTCGVVTNCYWATTERDAEQWLLPLRDLGLDDLSLSDDTFHSDDPENSPAKVAGRAAARLGIPTGTICIEDPKADAWAAAGGDRGEPVTGGEVLLKGRAVEKLAGGLPRKSFACFDQCSSEDLARPGRVHLDPFGNVFVCQGLSIGNLWQKPLVGIVRDFDPNRHPVIGPLLAGGPAELARRFGLPDGDRYASDCHLCYLVRQNLIDRFPEYLCPEQVYGVR